MRLRTLFWWLKPLNRSLACDLPYTVVVDYYLYKDLYPMNLIGKVLQFAYTFLGFQFSVFPLCVLFATYDKKRQETFKLLIFL